LYGKDGYWDNGGPSEDGFTIILYHSRLPIVTRN
jgi:hypothetical protein